MMQHLMITLGHNSSAAVVWPNGEIFAFEQERFDRIKSSSAFPKDAIAELIACGAINKDMEIEIYVSHWFDLENEDWFDCKYFDVDFLKSTFKRINGIYSTDSQCTHHDAHAYSVLAFADSHNYKEKANNDDPWTIIVADGFGNKQEVISVYDIDQFNRPKLKDRYYGYGHSLGLIYQYATSFCGMSENKDEYKFLGYESYILDYMSLSELTEFSLKIDNYVDDYFLSSERFSLNKPRDSISESQGGISQMEDVINFGFLKQTKEITHAMFKEWLHFSGVAVDMHEDPEFATRVVIGYAVQRFVENVMLTFLAKYNIKNLMTCGGIFYNVKLNNKLLNQVPGNYITNPLNGDQGAGLGLFKYYNYFHKCKFSGLIFGHDPEVNFEYAIPSKLRGNVVIGKEHDVGLAKYIANALDDGKIINLFRPGQEYGPRALCHTTTLALPTKENAEKINKMNDRNEVMPMAPVMHASLLPQLYEESEMDKVIGSDRYMVVTYHLKEGYHKDSLAGVLHKDPVKKGKFTSRPQVIDDASSDFMSLILAELKTPILINTSYNYHGEPIILTASGAVETFTKQCENAKANGIDLPYLFLVS